MKNIALFLIACMPALWLSAQQTSVANVDLRDVDGNIISSSQITQPGTPTILVFWKSSNDRCCDDLETISEAWEETLRQQGIRMVAICVDCNGSWSHVKPLVNGNSWDFDTYIDVNGDFKRAMSVGEMPCTMLFDGNQNLVCRYNAVCPGSEEFICENILNKLSTTITALYFETGR